MPLQEPTKSVRFNGETVSNCSLAGGIRWARHRNRFIVNSAERVQCIPTSTLFPWEFHAIANSLRCLCLNSTSQRGITEAIKTSGLIG